jgi:hypothetical protein
MRRIIKDADSEILKKNLKYIRNNRHNNKKIADILSKEQKKFCAYTEEFMSVTDADDIDHFNPKLKDTDGDNYNNWFLVKHKWNKKKSNKWLNYQPILHPSAVDFEERVIYIDGHYLTKSETDIEAQNLIDLLQLDEPALADKRRKYIARIKKDIKIYEQDYETYFSDLIGDNSSNVFYLRAIKEEFEIDIWEMLD